MHDEAIETVPSTDVRLYLHDYGIVIFLLPCKATYVVYAWFVIVLNTLDYNV